MGADTLDLHVFWPHPPPGCALPVNVAYHTHQKPLNKYMYIPAASAHPRHLQRAWVKSEVIRHATHCSSFYWFKHMCTLFEIRLVDRGFCSELVNCWFSEVDYNAVRYKLLHQPTPTAQHVHRRVPNYLKLRFDPLSCRLGVATLAKRAIVALNTYYWAFQWDPVLLCWCNHRALGSFCN